MQTQFPETAMNFFEALQEVQSERLLQVRQFGLLEQSSQFDVDAFTYFPTGQEQTDPFKKNPFATLQVVQTELEEHVKHPVIAIEHRAQEVLVL